MTFVAVAEGLAEILGRGNESTPDALVRRLAARRREEGLTLTHERKREGARAVLAFEQNAAWGVPSVLARGEEPVAVPIAGLADHLREA
ncbi:MAG: hypothetical protein M3Q49_05850 [Actinomycetota bacterium]|nr:hypothetical protein [Actinomycetota bacterium]